MSYRPDIDGLRAIAVLSVVGYHVGMPGFGGGFVGVDVFFVISGFLITRLLADELAQTGSIDLLGFYARRARRLLPAFLLVLIVTLGLGAVFLLPVDKEQQRLALSAVAATLYFSNFHFSRVGAGYFDGPSNQYPLLHTWSLAVEEQFYLVWPLILLGVAWIARRRGNDVRQTIIIVLSIILVASLAYSTLAVMDGGHDARHAFFGLQSRAWELAIGGLLALLAHRLHPRSNWVGAAIAGAGFAMIAVATTSYNESLPFPGAVALLPTVGAALMIAAGLIGPANIMSRLMSVRPLVAIGLVSYAWYLWHWPLLAIARAHELGVTDLARDSAIAGLAFGLAALTYWYVENPVRRSAAAWPSSRTLMTAGAASLVVLAASQALDGLANYRLPSFDGLLAAREDNYPVPRCDAVLHNRPEKYDLLNCEPRDDPQEPAFVVWGDSHAGHFAPMIDAVGKKLDASVLLFSKGSCPPLLGVTPFKPQRPLDHCPFFHEAVLEKIAALHSEGRLAGVFLGSWWVAHVGEPLISGEENPRRLRIGANHLTGEAAWQGLTVGLRSVLEKLEALNVRTVVALPAPMHKFSIPSCLARRSIEFCSVDRKLTNEFREPIVAAIASAANGMANVRVWDPVPLLCDNSMCSAKLSGNVAYRDDHHLTATAARFLAPHFAEHAAWLTGRAERAQSGALSLQRAH